MGSSLLTFAGELLIVLVVATAAIFVHLAVQRRFDYQRFERHNEVAGYLLSVVGVVYAVLLGFVVIVVWQRYTATQGYVQDEVAAVTDTYRLAAGFPTPVRTAIRSQLSSYVTFVLKNEWPDMRHGVALTPSTLLERVGYEVDTFHPANAEEADTQQMAMRELEELYDARRHRFAEVQPSVPPILWFALVAGGIVTIGFTYLFGMENRLAQLVMTGALAGIITVLFIVIVEFDFPFRGGAAVQSNGWAGLQQRFQLIR